MNKTILLLFMTILLVGTVSAAEWDNVKSYNEQNKTVTIKNSFLYIIPLSTIAQVTLDTPRVYHVGLGYQKVAQFTINPTKDYTSILGSFEFYDLNDKNKSIEKVIDVKYLVTEQISVDDYGVGDCYIIKNGTKYCERVIIGSHLEEKKTWKDFNGDVKTDEQIVIGLFTNVGVEETTEWIPKIAGVRINEWAVFTSGASTTTDGDYTVVTYLANGTFNTTANLNSTILVVAGGGGAGKASSQTAGGGGGGGYIYNVSYIIPTGNYDIIVGVGGAGATVGDNSGNQGTNSSFSSNSYFQANGGGKGQGVLGGGTGSANGGSGGGGSSGGPGGGTATPSWQGNNGAVAGGGGCGGAGSGDTGGAGCSNSINGTSVSYASGGSYQPGGNGRANSGNGGHANGGNGGSGVVIIRYLTADSSSVKSVILNYPANNTNLSSSSVTFSIIPVSSAVTSGINVSLYGNWSGGWHLNISNTSALNNTQTNFTITGIPDGKYIWNAFVNDGTDSRFNESNFTFTKNTAPLITINAPLNNTNSTNVYMFFNSTITDVGAGIDNVTLFINNTIYNSNSSGYNGTYTFNQSLPDGVYNFTIRANLSGDGSLSAIRFFTLNRSYVTNFNYNLTTYETAEERYYANVTTNGSIPSANFTFNGTTYSATVTNTVNNDFNLSSLIQIPLGGHNINRSFYFSYTLNSVGYNTPTKNQNVSELVFTEINSSYTNDFLNLSFKDEVSLVTINASVPTSTFIYYLGNGTINKTYTYTNTLNNFNYTFAGYPTDRNINVLPVLQYKQGSDYPQRIWQPLIKSYNSSVYNQVLYLLGSADGIYVTFQTVNPALQTITGVDVNITKISDSSLVGAGTTDGAGVVTFFLNPDIQQQVCFSKANYVTQCITIFPTQTAYTITMSLSSTTSTDYTIGIIRTISPSASFLDQYSVHSFNYTLNSSFWTVQKFEFRLFYGNDTLIISNSSTGNGGTITYQGFNVSNTTYVYMNYSYIVNDTALNYTRVWIVQSTSGREYSIFRFFTDLTLYLDSGDGFWGIDDFAQTFIAVIIMIITIGVISNRYGIANEASIMAILFSIVFFLDVSLGFIPRIQFGNVVAVEHFPTILTFIILMALVIREERR